MKKNSFAVETSPLEQNYKIDDKRKCEVSLDSIFHPAKMRSKMTGVLHRHISASCWCGILVLCLAIFLQFLGVPGTMFNVIDSQDDFQASVMLGFTIASGTASLLTWLTSGSASTESPFIHLFLRSYTFFHPPLCA